MPVEELRTAEAVLIAMAGWVETPWRTPNWGPLVFALSRVLRNAYLMRLSDLERFKEEEARATDRDQNEATAER
jgi:hypothetical protein